ncbi:MAG: HNH endonuclease signature motif containing protein [Steroidobacteraceae bacterium]
MDRPEYLIASHAKPWRDSSNDERLDGENGLLLTPTVDHLFDRGFISFEGNGRVIVSPVAHAESLRGMGVNPAVPISEIPSQRRQNRGNHPNWRLVLLVRKCLNRRRFPSAPRAVTDFIASLYHIRYRADPCHPP